MMEPGPFLFVPFLPDARGLALYVAAALVLAVTPGPGIFYVAARSLAGGRNEGVASSLGTGLGGMVHVLAGALGFSALILTSAEWFTALKWLGVAYLVWLGLRTLITAAMPETVAVQDLAGMDPSASGHGSLKAFREGVMVEALNPKTAAFFLAFIPQFVDPALGYAAGQFVMLGSISVALNTLVDIIVACAASRIRDGACARPKHILRLRQASGALMIALAMGLALAKHPAQ